MVAESERFGKLSAIGVGDGSEEFGRLTGLGDVICGAKVKGKKFDHIVSARILRLEVSGDRECGCWVLCGH